MDDDPAYDIAVAHSAGHPIPDDTPLIRAIEAALHAHAVTAAQINVVLVDDDQIAQLNERHLSHAGPTDVLTFDMRETGTGNGEGAASIIEGEIVISVETALREAQVRGHDVVAELALYAVHGTLHLLGYDDAEEVDARRMHEKEDAILGSVGLGAVYGGTSQ